MFSIKECSPITFAARRSKCACEGTRPGTLTFSALLLTVHPSPLKSKTFCPRVIDRIDRSTAITRSFQRCIASKAQAMLRCDIEGFRSYVSPIDLSRSDTGGEMSENQVDDLQSKYSINHGVLRSWHGMVSYRHVALSTPREGKVTVTALRYELRYPVRWREFRF